MAMHSTDARAANASHEPAASRFAYPSFLIVLGDGSYHTLWGDVRGQDVTGIPIFGQRSLAEEQVEQDAIDGTVLEVPSASAMKQIAATMVNAWFFYFADEECEMAAVKASHILCNSN